MANNNIGNPTTPPPSQAEDGQIGAGHGASVMVVNNGGHVKVIKTRLGAQGDK